MNKNTLHTISKENYLYSYEYLLRWVQTAEMCIYSRYINSFVHGETWLSETGSTSFEMVLRKSMLHYVVTKLLQSVYLTSKGYLPGKCTAVWQVSKGQLISKCPFGVFKSPKRPTKYFPGFLP